MAQRKPTKEGAGAFEAYLARLPDAQRAALERVRALVHAAAPGAEETMAYGIPTFRLAGRNLVHMAAFRAHLSFFPGAGGVAGGFAKDLRGFETAKGTIRFTLEKPLPAALVKRIVRLRVAEETPGSKTPARPAAKKARVTKAKPRRRASRRGT